MNRVGEMLRSRGFADVHTVFRQAATRDGVLAAFESLIARTGPGDAVVVYYSGHGHSVETIDHARARREGRPPPPRVQMIVPFDFDLSGDHDYRVVLSHELSVFFRRLTRITRNVTTLFDCCFAAHMSRDPVRAGEKVLINVNASGLEETLARLGIDRALVTPADAAGNPDTVRLAACGADQIAHEYERPDGQWVSVFTEALLAVMDERGSDVTWGEVGRLARERVLERFPSQRPDVDGAAERILFRTETR